MLTPIKCPIKCALNTTTHEIQYKIRPTITYIFIAHSNLNVAQYSANSVAYKELIKEILNKQARNQGMGIRSK